MKEKNVDIEIFMNNFMNFFDNNPNDLLSLIGDTNKQEFYDRVRLQCYENYKNGEDIAVTRQQMIDIIVNMKGVKEIVVKDIDKLFHKTNYGYFGLN